MIFSNFVKLLYGLLLLAIFSSNSFAFSVQVNELYEYDLNSNLSIAKQSEVTHEKRVYDEGCNFIHCGIEQKLKFRSEKTQSGSFFAFEVGLVAAKGGDNVTVYRGVSAKHPGLAEAKQGIATPRGGILAHQDTMSSIRSQNSLLGRRTRKLQKVLLIRRVLVGWFLNNPLTETLLLVLPIFSKKKKY